MRQLEEGKLDEALAALERAREMAPDDAQVYFHLGRLRAERQEYAPAVAAFRRSISLRPGQPQSYLQLAALQGRLGQIHQARQTLSELEQQQPGLPEAQLLLGRLAAEEQDFEQAEAQLRAYVEKRPQDAQGLSELAAALLTLMRQEEAETLLRKALQIDPALANAHYNLGLAYSRLGEYGKARQHLEKALKGLPGSDAALQLGRVQMQMGQTEAAEATLRQALDASPDSPQAHYLLAAVVRRNGKAEEAERLMARHRELTSQASRRDREARQVSSLHNEALELLERNQAGAAETKLDQILQLDPGNDLAYYRKGQIEYLRRNDRQALDYARRAQALKEFEPSYPFLQAMCLERLRRPLQAAQAYRRVLSLFEYSPAHSALARIETGQGNLDKALFHWRRAVELEPENPELRLLFANALEKAGQIEESRQQRSLAGRLRQNRP